MFREFYFKNIYFRFEDESSSPGLRSPKFTASPPNISYRGWWTFPYYSCNERRWILSYSVAIPPIGRHGMRGFLSIDIDVSELQVNQCDLTPQQREIYKNYRHNKFTTVNIDEQLNQIEAFHGSNKCHSKSMKCEYRMINTNFQLTRGIVNTNNWLRGAYQCLCKQGFYSLRHPNGFNGTIMEVAYQEFKENISTYYEDVFRCLPCAPGCVHCLGPSPCLASYNWPFRISILTISILCAIFTIALACYMYKHRKVKVFKVASPIFLTITLLGCAIMYLEVKKEIYYFQTIIIY